MVRIDALARVKRARASGIPWTASRVSYNKNSMME